MRYRALLSLITTLFLIWIGPTTMIYADESAESKSQLTVPWDEFKKLVNLDEDEIIISLEPISKIGEILLSDYCWIKEKKQNNDRREEVVCKQKVLFVDFFQKEFDTGYDYKERDFEHPSILFILEDKLKNLIGGSLFYNRYFETFKLEGNERVLDFGCGGGVGSHALANLLNKGGYLTCIDVSSYWIAKARKRLEKYSNVKCILGDIREAEIPDSSLDIISTIRVIHDIAPAERENIVKIILMGHIQGSNMNKKIITFYWDYYTYNISL